MLGSASAGIRVILEQCVKTLELEATPTLTRADAHKRTFSHISGVNGIRPAA